MSRIANAAVRAATVLLVLTGCNVVPVVQYTKIENNTQRVNITDSFYLARSEITLGLTIRENEKTGKRTEEYTIVSKPKAFEGFKVGVRPADSMRVTTKINIGKIDNTDLVSTFGAETTDNTVTLINQVGGAIVKVLSFVATVSKPTSGVQAPAPCVTEDDFPMKFILPTKNDPKAHVVQIDGSVAGCVTVSIGAIAADAQPIAQGFEFGTDTSKFFYAACRDAEVTFQQGTKKVTKPVRIADPNFVQYVQLPYKGSVTMHSECGASVKTESTSPNNAISIIDALATQGKAIRDALEAANK